MVKDQLQEVLESIDWALWISGAARVLVILFIWWLAVRIIRRLFTALYHRLLENQQSGSLNEQHKRVETLTRLLRQGVFILLTAVMILLLLREIGLDIAPLLASAGVIGVAVGFGAQSLVKDVISGFFIILENQVRINDVVVINGTGGLVEQVNFRTLILRDLSGTKHVLPNGEIKSISNMTAEWSAYVFDIGVSYREDPNHVMQVMSEVGIQMRQSDEFKPYILDDFEIFGVDAFGDSAIIIKGRVRTVPIQQWAVGREYKKRLKIRFDQEGISIPFPQRDIHVIDGPEGLLSRVLATQSHSPSSAADTLPK